MAGKVSVDYDIEEVIAFCENGAQTDIHNLVKDLNALTKELDNCQDKFHCKGDDRSNAVLKIYNNFSEIIGFNNGLQSGKNLGACVVGSANIVNTCYAEAKADLKAQEAAQYSGLQF